jgi:hypothetical protein
LWPNCNLLLLSLPQTQLRCTDDVIDDMCSVQCGRGLNLRSTGCPDRGAVGILPCMAKFRQKDRKSNPVPHD